MTIGTHPAWQNWRHRPQPPAEVAYAPPAEHGSWLDPLSAVPICLALALHWLLVLINTHVMPVSDMYVMGGEALILALSLALIGVRARPQFIGLVLAMVVYFTALWLIRGAIDPKTIRDLMIPVIFYELGRTRGSYKIADRVVVWASVFILAVAVIEMIWPTLYGEQFNIMKYYIARGEVPPEAATYFNTAFSVNGQRPAGIGRTFLPFLGPHRASSVFIEPVSLGNYAAIAATWFLLRQGAWWKNLLLLTIPVTMVILSDSRFGAAMLAVLFVVWLLRNVYLARLASPALPLLVMAGLGLIFLAGDPMTGDSMSGRLFYSGRALYTMGVDFWLGVVPIKKYIFDSGYADIIRNAGIIGVGAAWCLFVACFRREEQQFMKMFIIVYYALLLCVSASVFSIKTTAVLWFAFGCLGALGQVNRRIEDGGAH